MPNHAIILCTPNLKKKGEEYSTQFTCLGKSLKIFAHSYYSTAFACFAVEVQPAFVARPVQAGLERQPILGQHVAGEGETEFLAR